MRRKLIAAILASFAMIGTACEGDPAGGTNENGEQPQQEEQQNGGLY